jgi:hypothetical protein
MMPIGPRGASFLKMCVCVSVFDEWRKEWMNEWSSGWRLEQFKRIGFFSLSVYPSGILLARRTRGNWYHSVLGVSLSVMSDTPQCHGYHSVSGLFVRKTGSLSVMGKLLGGLWELSVRGKITQGMGITQCNGYPLGCVRNGYHSMSGYHSV